MKYVTYPNSNKLHIQKDDVMTFCQAFLEPFNPSFYEEKPEGLDECDVCRMRAKRAVSGDGMETTES